MIRGAALLVLAVVGCRKSAPSPDPASLVIAEARTIRTAGVGIGASEAPATYVLVDVRNTNDRAAVVELGGELFDGAGNSLGPTRTEMLTIPAGDARMFALVDGRRRVLDNATTAAIRLAGATFAHAEPRLLITNEKQYSDQGRAVVAGYVENRGEGAVTVMVIAGFYDAAGVPMDREAVPYRIDGGQRRGTRHVGPAGSARGVLFVSDFH